MKKQLFRAAALVFTALFFFSAPAWASPQAVPEKADVIIIGDRLADIAYHLGVVPSAMSVRCSLWPLCDTLKSSVQVLGCPSCLAKKKGKPLLDYAQKHHIKQVIIEKGDPFCLLMPTVQPEASRDMYEEKGLRVNVIPVGEELKAPVMAMAALLDRKKQAREMLETHDEKMAQAEKFIAGRKFAPKVVILNGVFQASTGKTFLRLQASGGYADQYILNRLGSRNVGSDTMQPGKKPSKGHFTIRKLDRLIQAAPDAVIITGDPVPVQKAIAKAAKEINGFAQIPAVQHHAVYSLPGFVNSSVVEFPGILEQWARALEIE